MNDKERENLKENNGEDLNDKKVYFMGINTTKYKKFLEDIGSIIYNLGRLWVLYACLYYMLNNDSFSVSCGIMEDSWLREFSTIRKMCDSVDMLGTYWLALPGIIVAISYADLGIKLNPLIKLPTVYLIAQNAIYNTILNAKEGLFSYFSIGSLKVIEKNFYMKKEELADKEITQAFSYSRPYSEGYKKEYLDFTHNYLAEHLKEIHDKIASTPLHDLKILASEIVKKVEILYKESKHQNIAEKFKSSSSNTSSESSIATAVPVPVPAPTPTVSEIAIKNSDVVATMVQNTGTNWVFWLIAISAGLTGLLFVSKYFGGVLKKIETVFMSQDDYNKKLADDILKIIDQLETNGKISIKDKQLYIESLKETTEFLKHQKTINTDVQTQIKILEGLINEKKGKEIISDEKMTEITNLLEKAESKTKHLDELQGLFESLRGKTGLHDNIIETLRAESETLKKNLSELQTNFKTYTSKEYIESYIHAGPVHDAIQKTLLREKEITDLLGNAKKIINNIEEKDKVISESLTKTQRWLETLDKIKGEIITQVTKIVNENVKRETELDEKGVTIIKENIASLTEEQTKALKDTAEKTEEFVALVGKAQEQMAEYKSVYEKGITVADKINEAQTVIETGFMFMTEIIQTLVVKNPELPIAALVTGLLVTGQNYWDYFKDFNIPKFQQEIKEVKEAQLLAAQAQASVPDPEADPFLLNSKNKFLEEKELFQKDVDNILSDIQKSRIELEQIHLEHEKILKEKQVELDKKQLEIKRLDIKLGELRFELQRKEEQAATVTNAIKNYNPGKHIFGNK